METLNRASSTLIIKFQDFNELIFNFRGLAVLSRNLRNINASKIPCYTVQYIHHPLMRTKFWLLQFLG